MTDYRDYRHASGHIHAPADMADRVVARAQREQLLDDEPEADTGSGRSGRIRRLWRGWGFWQRVAAVAAVLALAVPATAWGVGTIVRYFAQVSEEGHVLRIDTATSPAEDGDGQLLVSASARQPVRLVLPEIEGYQLVGLDEDTTANMAGYDAVEGFDAGRSFRILLVQVDEDISAGMLVDDVAAWENVQVGGHDAIYVSRGASAGFIYARLKNFIQQVFVFFPDEGYLLQVFAQEGLSRDELLGYLELIGVESCDEEEASAYERASWLYEEVPESAVAGEAPVYTASDVHQMGETVASGGVEYTVEGVTVLDTVADILAQGGAGMTEEDYAALAALAGSDGSLPPYARQALVYGDGVNSYHVAPGEVEDINLRLVMIELRVRNTGGGHRGDLLFVGSQLVFIDSTLAEDSSTRAYDRPSEVSLLMLDGLPVYFDGMVGGRDFCYAMLAEGEEAVYRLGYLVDEDYLDEACYGVGGRGAEVVRLF